MAQIRPFLQLLHPLSLLFYSLITLLSSETQAGMTGNHAASVILPQPQADCNRYCTNMLHSVWTAPATPGKQIFGYPITFGVGFY